MPKDPPTTTSPPYLEEAKALARAQQKPGQTKEQTRLIAQGIARGIEQYKRQQSAKARERDKSRKRLEKLRQTSVDADLTDSPPGSDPAAEVRSTRPPMLLGGVAMGLSSLALAWLLLQGWAVTIAGWPVPSGLLGGWMLIMAGLATWLLSHALRNP